MINRKNICAELSACSYLAGCANDLDFIDLLNGAISHFENPDCSDQRIGEILRLVVRVAPYYALERLGRLQ